MNPFIQTTITSIIASGGFAAILTFVQFIIKRHDDKKDKKNGIQAELKNQCEKLNNLTSLVEEGNEESKKTRDRLEIQGEAIAGLEHDRILHIGKGYIQRKHISLEDYDDIRIYLYEPYRKLGGNGTAEEIMKKLESMVENKG